MADPADPKVSATKTSLLEVFVFGAGFGLLFLATVVLLVSKSGRPASAATTWDSRALTATYDFVTSEGDPQHIVFAYTLQNNTNQDYRLDGHEDIELVNKLLTEKSIYRPTDKGPEMRFPVFVPANGRTTFLFDEPSEYAAKNADDSDPERHRANVQEFVKDTYANVDGFILFDHTHMYQIDLPKGW
jgi:hypothetical protein